MLDGCNYRLAENAAYVRAELDPVVQDVRCVGIVDQAEEAGELRREVVIDANHVVAPRVRGASLLEVVHYVQLRRQCRRKVWQREKVEHGLAHWIDPRCRYDVARERLVVIVRIQHADQAAVVVKALGEIARPLQRGRCVLVYLAAGYKLADPFLGHEEEEPLLVRVPMLRNIHGTAKAISLDVVPVRHSRSSGAVLDGVVIDPGVGVEFLMTVVPGGRAVKVLGSVLGHHRDGSARVSSEFGGIVRSQYLQFLNRVEVRLKLHRSVRSGIHVGDAVDRKVERRRGSVDIHAADGAVAGYVAAGSCINHTGNQLDVAEQIPTLQGEIFEVLRVDRLGLLAAVQLHLSRFGRDSDRVGCAANLEHHLSGVVGFLRAYHDAGLRYILEPGCGDHHIVGTRIEVDEPEGSQVVGGGVTNRAGAGVRPRYARPP